ncbi:legionella vir region protein [Leadbettera azotonutricia ZAS-9]|uniref:Legionella vir region protein n=2 Tax=Leadbettera azotonutricia TaxID=150829 RepID=F5YFF5_LEAAZ|nr:legionella vir region protein [Leadbettera azotonutricia ZAS-9]
MGFYLNGWRYLEAAPADIPGVWQWGTERRDVNSTTNGIGNGKRNTQIIVELLKEARETMKATQVADAYEYNGFSDWFLPSKDELNQMYINLKVGGLGGFQSGSYWSSSENTSFGLNPPFCQKFSNGEQSQAHKDTSLLVRPIRQF